MKGESKSLGGGFEHPSNGWHAFEIDDGIEFTKDKDGAATSTLVVPMFVIDDDEEEGRKVFPRFDLTDKRGLKGLATLLYWSKLYSAIEKNFKITDGADLDEEAWGVKFLKVDDSEQAAKIVDALISKLPGKSIFAETSKRTVPMKDRDDPTQTRDVTFCNVGPIRNYGDKEVLSKMKEKKGAGGKPASEVKEDSTGTEDWPE